MIAGDQHTPGNGTSIGLRRHAVATATMLLVVSAPSIAGDARSGRGAMPVGQSEAANSAMLEGFFSATPDGPVLRLIFTNRGAAPLWVPDEPVPAYQPDAGTLKMTVSFGYFDEIYGRYRAQYMIPPMRRVEPGQRLEWFVSDRALIDKARSAPYKVVVRIRVALREIAYSRVRGAQDLETYLQHSRIVTSPEIAAR